MRRALSSSHEESGSASRNLLLLRGLRCSDRGRRLMYAETHLRAE